MRISRAKAAFAAAGLILACAAPADAQLGPPVSLTPQRSEAAPGNGPPPPGTVLPAPMIIPGQGPATYQGGANQAAPDEASPDSGGADVKVQPLAPIDPSWAGTLGAADRALPNSMWSGTPRALVAAALPLLEPTTSPILQDLSRRLLLSDAIPPAGNDPASGPSLAALQLDRILALGRSDGAAVADALPQTFASEAVDRDTVELRIAAGDRPDACKLVTDRVAGYEDAWWERAVVACQALAGDYDQAALGLSALRDQKATRDPAFETLIDAILGHRQALEKLPHPTPLTLALLADAKLPLPADALASANPAALALYATSDKPPIGDRLAAGEKAAAFGALPPAELGLLYGAVRSTPQEQAAVIKNGKLPDDPKSRAILYTMARLSEPGSRRIAALRPLLADARRRGAFVSVAQLVAPLVSELQPMPDDQSFAGEAARVLLAAHALDRAAPWITLADQPQLRVLAALAGVPESDGPPPFAAALAALMARDAATAPRQADLLLALGAALGQPAGNGATAMLLQPAHQGMLPAAAVWRDQEEAARTQRIGETVLMTVLMAEAGPNLSPEPIVLAQAVAGLAAAGLDNDARTLAIESALDAGI